MVQFGQYLSATCSMIELVVPVNCPSTFCIELQSSRPPQAPTPAWKARQFAATARGCSEYHSTDEADR